ncbi:MAG: class I SAM-dependent methyltransferase [Planctomycetota bacterium]|jgi:SAM-dependent methyltransferase
MNKIEQQRVHFESVAQKYFLSRQEWRHLYYKELLWNFFFENKKFLKDSTLVLEPMCGYAEGKLVLETFLGSKIDYQGFDYCDSIVETAKNVQPQLNIYKMDITKFEPTQKFDIVILIGGLHHVPDFANQIIAKISESLHPGGYFISFEPTHGSVLIKVIRNMVYKYNSFFDNLTENDFQLERLNALYEENGFEIADQIYPGLLSYILYYNPDAFPSLNIGGRGTIKFIFGIDKFFMKSFIGKKMSFTALSLLRKK